MNLAMTSSNVNFAGTASAGNASITNISNVNMNDFSTLANATVTKNGGNLNFLNFSSGGQASIILDGNSQLRFVSYGPRYHDRFPRRIRYREPDGLLLWSASH